MVSALALASPSWTEGLDVDNQIELPNNSDAGLIKRGFVLLALMSLLVTVVLFILLQGRHSPAKAPTTRAEDYALSVAMPAAGFPANISWGALRETAAFVPSPTGWEVRYNAAATMAELGSDQVPWDLFREMLDLQRVTVNLREQLKDKPESPEASARDVVAIALRAVAEWHAKRREANKTDMPAGLTAVYEAVDSLASSPDRDLREQAKKTQATFFGR
jgi:hypothetical protein